MLQWVTANKLHRIGGSLPGYWQALTIVSAGRSNVLLIVSRFWCSVTDRLIRRSSGRLRRPMHQAPGDPFDTRIDVCHRRHGLVPCRSCAASSRRGGSGLVRNPPPESIT
jgi:hypothetical protein